MTENILMIRGRILPFRFHPWEDLRRPVAPIDLLNLITVKAGLIRLIYTRFSLAYYYQILTTNLISRAVLGCSFPHPTNVIIPNAMHSSPQSLDPQPVG